MYRMARKFLLFGMLQCILFFGWETGRALAQSLPPVPLGVTTAAKPMTLIVMEKDHKLFYEAYNDASDLDGDGVLDIHFKPNITYYGLFDPNLCYSYKNELFQPKSVANNGKCGGNWSGNWLNYVTTSRIDAIRKVLYGGYREVDSETQTILRRAYIPQDAHSWAKEYTGPDVDGYNISDYTPLSKPSQGKRHFFANLTQTNGINCSNLDTCSNLPPKLWVVTNSSVRVWDWASNESPVLDDDPNIYGGTSYGKYTVRVEVCTQNFHDGCKAYPNHTYKPVGLLHEYGEDGSMLFGLLTGSYNKNMSGGVLRKVVSSFSEEVDENTGVFTKNNIIVRNMNNLRIRDYNNGTTGNAYRGGWVTTRPMNEGEFVDWGNPIGEMMYEGLRYFAGKKSATTAFATSGSYDADVGLTVATWDDPYDAGSAAKAPWCAKPSMIVVSDINPSFDSDQLPGSSFGSFSGDLTGLDVTALAGTITAAEPDVTGLHFIGQSGTIYDNAPTAKNVASLGTIRGLAPEEPTKQGSYYSAAVAYYGKTHDLNDNAINSQTLDSFFVALSSPLPKIEIRAGLGYLVTLVPFAKSVGGSSIDNKKGSFQPTDQIVDFYVDTIANSDPSGSDRDEKINGGRYYAKFRINYEDVEQGADHDMDAVVEYEISLQPDNTVKVKVSPIYQCGGIKQNMGYVISGTTKDGVYLVVQDEDVEISYYLNTPPNMDPGECDVENPPSACKKLPHIVADPKNACKTQSYQSSERIFTPGGSAATLLKNPLWYAAKWGGFIDSNGDKEPDIAKEWDSDGDGVPDTYFPVQNPLKLKEALKRALDNIVERSASASNVSANSTSVTTDSMVYQAIFNTANWSGDLLAYPVTSSGVTAFPVWRASDHIPSPEKRNIFTRSDGGGKEFQWTKLSHDDQLAIGSQDVLNFLRGDRSKEGGTFRTRGSSVLGDIVHSSPLYVKDSNTVYVGANDGMLHAFDASTGTELFAYVPSQSIPKVKNLSDVRYGTAALPHAYFVDGEIAVSARSQTQGRNYLAATLGYGGKGLFGLDVTNPSSFGISNVLWEYSDATDLDLGYMIGRPIIAKMNDGSSAVIVGNGYGSTNGRAVLYIFDLTTGSLLKKIDTGAAGSNMLSSPGVFDSDGNGTIDYIYAGDLKGNVWKFDVSGTDRSSWGVALSGDPLFTAVDPGNVPQPITAPVTIVVDDVAGDLNYGKRFIFFGTGSYFRSGDPSDMQIQSWYGLIDDNARISGRSALKERTVQMEGRVNGYPVRTFSEAVAGDMAGKKGWYIDLKTAGGVAQGERIVTESKYYKLAEPTLIASSIIPVVDPCVPGGTGYVNTINPFTGGSLKLPFFDLNRNADYSDDMLNNKVIGSVDVGVGMPGAPVVVGDELVVGGSSGETKSLKINPGSPPQRGRISWREIILN